MRANTHTLVLLCTPLESTPITVRHNFVWRQVIYSNRRVQSLGPVMISARPHGSLRGTMIDTTLSCLAADTASLSSETAVSLYSAAALLLLYPANFGFCQLGGMQLTKLPSHPSLILGTPSRIQPRNATNCNYPIRLFTVCTYDVRTFAGPGDCTDATDV